MRTVLLKQDGFFPLGIKKKKNLTVEIIMVRDANLS